MATRSRIEPRRFVDSGSRTEPTPQLTDDQWFLIEDLFPDPQPSPLGGRPRHSNRDCLEGILFVLLTGCRWKDLPASFPSKSVCHQRFTLWVRTGVFRTAWLRLLELKDDLKQLDLDTLLGDATFVPAKKGATTSDRPSPAKVPRLSC
jgi:transposase